MIPMEDIHPGMKLTAMRTDETIEVIGLTPTGFTYRVIAKPPEIKGFFKDSWEGEYYGDAQGRAWFTEVSV